MKIYRYRLSRTRLRLSPIRMPAGAEILTVQATPGDESVEAWLYVRADPAAREVIRNVRLIVVNDKPIDVPDGCRYVGAFKAHKFDFHLDDVVHFIVHVFDLGEQEIS